MKKLFVTGLVILLPLTVTLAIAVFIFNLLTTPFIGVVSSVLDYFGLFENGFWFISGAQLRQYLSQILILFIMISFTIGSGFIARWVFFPTIAAFGEFLLHKIPFISSIYKTSQDVIKTIFTTDSNSFKQVVMVPFPHGNTYSIGLLTGDQLPSIKEESYVAVFVPTTPNPTSGFLLMVKRIDLVFLDMKVEEALKYVISCGVVVPTYKIISSQEAIDRLKPLENEFQEFATE